jgi:hypothetical protein
MAFDLHTHFTFTMMKEESHMLAGRLMLQETKATYVSCYDDKLEMALRTAATDEPAVRNTVSHKM